MSRDLSMFKKMKDIITDEVNSATNKLQNMQIIDQLANTINQQMKNELVNPNLALPEHPHHIPAANNKFSLMDDSPAVMGGYDNDEINSEISPQHQLFDENSILRLQSTTIENGISSLVNFQQPTNSKTPTVINISELSSDIEDGYKSEDDPNLIDNDLDVEIDLLSDKPLVDLSNRSSNGDNHQQLDKNYNNPHKLIPHYKHKYRSVVHAIRKLNQQYILEKNQVEFQKVDLTNQITALKIELDNIKQQNQQHDSLASGSTNVSEHDRSNVGSPQPASRSSAKLKDLEKLLAKCKESLKSKNAQIKLLKDSLSEVEKFKELNQGLKDELAELREAHEFWTVSIAENKRVMHQELESKNNEMDKFKSEIKDLQLKLTDSNGKIRQLKSAIQDLESRIVSTSVAHQKERESLTKELTKSKNLVIKQLQAEQEHQIERVKLDSEKSIEALKLELYHKDEHIIRDATLNQQLQEKIQTLTNQIDDYKMKLEQELEKHNDDTKSEKFQQELHELNTQLAILNTANEDQEKEIQLLKSERDKLNELYKHLDVDFIELSKKNESLLKVIKDNETDMLVQQEQLDQLTVITRELDSLKTENGALNQGLIQYKNELNEKNSDLLQYKKQTEDLEERLLKLTNELEIAKKICTETTIERDALNAANEGLLNQIKDLNKKIIIGILSAMKNLETPNTSPGSDKSYQSYTNKDQSDESGCDKKELPDPSNLMEELSSLAFDRSNAYMTVTQRLQAVLLDNTMISEENKRLKDELSNISREKALESLCSMEEAEVLNTENQALIHDQQYYDNKVRELEEEIDAYRRKFLKMKEDEEKLQELNETLMVEKKRLETITKDESKGEIAFSDATQFEYLKNIIFQFMLGKQPLVLAKVISAVFQFDKSQVDEICKVQEMVQSVLG